MITVQHFFDTETSTLTYVVWDPSTRDGIIIDPVWNYDPASSKLTSKSADLVTAFLKEQSIKPHWILETHAHADHVSGAQLLKHNFPAAKIGIGEGIIEVQKVFQPIFDLTDLKTDGSQFDKLFKDNEVIGAGSIQFKVIFTPGHTPACCSYLIEDTVFTGDALFMPDTGTGRCDFPIGSADSLYTSVSERLYNLPDKTRVFTGHDYQAGGREVKFESTIGEEKANNIHIKGKTTREEYVSFRTQRDKNLSAPKLLLPSLQVNIDGGRFPKARPNGKSYLNIPISIKP
jgi:glyoxylase-like metal-dependent hydrolase (beta-lactamase superfamily II)